MIDYMAKFLFISLLLSSHSLIAQVWPSEGINNLKGDIIKIRETVLIPQKAKKELGKCDTGTVTIRIFNENKTLTKDTLIFWPFSDWSEKSTTVTEYRYSNSNQLISERYCDLTNEFCTENIYSFDQSGRSIEVIAYSEKGDSISRKQFDYNSSGLEIERRIYDAFVAGNNLLYTYRLKYDSSRQIIKREFFTPDRSIKSEHTFEYQDGLLIRTHSISKKGKKYTTEITYEFDEVGNWINQTSRVKGKITDYTIREIVYRKN